MYELIKKILETGKERNVDLSVAYAMLCNEEGETSELKEAKKMLDQHYKTITALRRNGYEEELKDFINAEDKLAFKKELEKRGLPTEN